MPPRDVLKCGAAGKSLGDKRERAGPEREASAAPSGGEEGQLLGPLPEITHRLFPRRNPHVTEKSTLKKELSEGRVIAFQVRPDASKRNIKEAVEQIFDVKVEKVRTANFIGKIKRQGRTKGRRPSWKKAYVTLKRGQKPIEFFEGV